MYTCIYTYIYRYASMSFTEIGYREDKLVRLDIRINGDDAPPLATIGMCAVQYCSVMYMIFV